MVPSAVRPWPDCPLVVAYGLGVDSTALLVEFARRGIRPDLILFADTRGEKPETLPVPRRPPALPRRGWLPRRCRGPLPAETEVVVHLSGSWVARRPWHA